MVNISLKNIDPENIQKNNLYRVSEPVVVEFVEHHDKGNESVYLDYQLVDEQYGIYATEYRSPVVKKEYKSTDILACVVDDSKKEVYTLICDVKSNISSFSDDLTKNAALLTAIREVQDFTDQVSDEMLHKESFMIYYEKEGYEEHCELAIATKNFEHQKFTDAANFLEDLFQDKSDNIPMLTRLDLLNTLKPYKDEVQRLRKFGDEILLLHEREYKLTVFLLEKDKDGDNYKKKIRLSC